jgi:glycosyltransferase involved in cell wall biosynthesis
MIGICITTYNHESYIAQAIDSVLAQECDEPIRIYIGDDASTDGTQAICEQYAAKDNRIVYIRRERNLGLVGNTLDLYRRIIADGCTYVAMLDGDDYWLKEDKLQIQIDYLQTHPQVGLVHTAAYDDVEGQLEDLDHADKPVGDIRLRYNREGASHTNCTVVFRTELLQEEDLKVLDEQKFLVLDYPLYGIFSQHTQFGYIHVYTAAWRRHSSVSQPRTVGHILRYQYHYARAWRWLDKRYNGNFHFRWTKCLAWYLWKVFYTLVSACKRQICKK